MKHRTAVVAGAGGLVGSYLLSGLLDSPDYGSIHIFTRRTLALSHPKVTEHITDFTPGSFPDITTDEVFCALGTTIRKAGSQAEFRKVDHDYVVNLGQWAETHGAGKFLVVSAMGAVAHSKIFYNRVKGEMEDAISRFNIGRVMVFRPSLLMGKRHEKRVGEAIAQVFMKILGFLFAGPLLDFKGIHARRVADAMIHAADQGQNGFRIYRSGELQKMGKNKQD